MRFIVNTAHMSTQRTQAVVVAMSDLAPHVAHGSSDDRRYYFKYQDTRKALANLGKVWDTLFTMLGYEVLEIEINAPGISERDVYALAEVVADHKDCVETAALCDDETSEPYGVYLKFAREWMEQDAPDCLQSIQ
jgi:hypothetical protein